MSDEVIAAAVVKPAHGYTREDSPWIIEGPDAFRCRLVRFLAGGGMHTFGRTISQEIARAKHRRFMFATAAIAVCWLALYIF